MIHTIAPVIRLIEVDSGTDATTLDRWAAAMTRGMLEDFGPLWNVLVTVIGPGGGPLKPGEWPSYQHALPTATDPSGALAYHGRLPDGTPCSHNFVKLCEQYGDDPTSAADHEHKEMTVDELLNEAVMNMGDGSFYAKEVCDPCEQVGYAKDGISLSDFVTPEWFAPADKPDPDASYNFLKTITAPFGILAGGYAQKYDPKTGWQQLGQKSARRAYLDSLGLSRTARRIASFTP